MAAISGAIDQLLRRTFLAIINDPEHRNLFLSAPKVLEEYLTDLALGTAKPKAPTHPDV